MLNRRVSRVVIFTLLGFTVGALAQDPPAISNDAPIQVETVSSKKVYKSIKNAELKQFVLKFKAGFSKEQGNVLKLQGWVTKKCAPHLRIQLDTPSEDEGTLNHSLRIEKTDFISDADSSKVIESADDACSIDEVRSCEPESCIKLSSIAGAKLVESTEFEHDSKVLYCTTDRLLDEEDQQRNKCDELGKNQGGPLAYKTAATLKAEAEAIRKMRKLEMVESKCADAEKGDRSAIDELEQLLGENLSKEQKNLITTLKSRVDMKDFETLAEKLNSSNTVEELNDLIDEVVEFAEDHKGMEKELLILLGRIADKADPSDMSIDESDRQHHARLKTAERALEAAHRIDPLNSGATTALYAEKLKRFKWASETSGDLFYNDVTRREIDKAYSYAMRGLNSKNEDMRALANRYKSEVLDPANPSMIPNVLGMTPSGPIQAGYYAGTKLEETFVKKSIEQQFKEFQAKYNQVTGAAPNSQSNGAGNTAPSGPLNGNSF